ncbi:hypothetical protein KR032_006126, partial [Drosophila birchii]
KRKSKARTKCFGGTVFRCCLPCRGGGSAAPATSPPQTPAQTPDELKARPDNYQEKPQDNQSQQHQPEKQPSVEGADDQQQQRERLLSNPDLYPSCEKKHSLAETINTSVTTPISLKTLINDVDEEELLGQQLSAADIAAASLASGLVARRAEPETLSDASVSPTAVVQQQQLAQPPAHLVTTTCSGSLLSQVTLYSSSPVNQAPNPTQGQAQSPSTSANPNPNTNPNPNPSQSQNQNQNQNPNQNQQRCSCQPQTSPLPHIKEEEESEQANSRQLSLKEEQQQQEPEQQQLPPITIASGYCGSCESVHHSSATSSSGGTAPAGSQQAQEYIGGTSSTPSPRIKLKFRKPHKSCWSRIVLAPIGSAGGSSSAGGSTVIGSNSNETLASSSTTGGTATTTQNSSSASVAAHHRLTSSSASALASSHPSNSQLLPTSKMQAEQGSIGDLQKYHSRYLKNRRHTLANVR